MIVNDAKTSHGYKDRTGNLSKGFKVRKSKFKNGGYLALNTAPHAHLIEFGHDLVKGGKKDKGGEVIGFIEGKPFMRPALERQRSKIYQMAQGKLFQNQEGGGTIMTTVTLQLNDKLSQQLERMASDRKVNLTTLVTQLLAQSLEEGSDELFTFEGEGNSRYVLRIPGELHCRLQERAEILEVYLTEFAQKCLEIGLKKIAFLQ